MTSAAERIRTAIENGGEKVWTMHDFPGLPSLAVAQTLSRLAKTGSLTRVGKGTYYRVRETTFGLSQPNPKLLRERVAKVAPVFPSGLTAAHLLGFSTQVPAREELATTSGSLPRSLVGSNVLITTRRPTAWRTLSNKDAALLDFIRNRGEGSELSPVETLKKVLEYLAEGRTFENLLRVATSEPPRVRALLGSLGQELGKSDRKLKSIRRTLNPLSRFDFGVLSAMKSAPLWQAKESAIS